MNVEDFRELCLSMPFAKENAPWSEPEYEDLLTYTIGDKWFCLLDLKEKRCNLKCDPENILDLQEAYKGIVPAWHMNKKYWFTLYLDSDVQSMKIEELVRKAYSLVVKKLTKAKRQELGLS